VWSEFHEHVEKLPDDEREVMDLLWYQGLTQEEAAAVLKVSDRTVKRRWQSAPAEAARRTSRRAARHLIPRPLPHLSPSFRIQATAGHLERLHHR